MHSHFTLSMLTVIEIPLHLQLELGLILIYNAISVISAYYLQCLLGLQFLNPNKSGEMADLLKNFQEKYVPRVDQDILHPTIMVGDQLTEERSRNVQWTYHLGDTAFERLEGIEPTFSEFHLKMCLYEVVTTTFLFYEF